MKWIKLCFFPGERIHDTEEKTTRSWVFVGGCVCTSEFWKSAVFLFLAMCSHDLKKNKPQLFISEVVRTLICWCSWS